MAHESIRIQLDEFVRDATRILDDVDAHNRELVLEDRGRLFRLTRKRKPSRTGRSFSRQDPLFALGGAFASKEETDIAHDEVQALAAAYEDTHD